MSGWRDISTAPKDGTRFLAYEVIGPMDEEDEDGFVIARGKYERGQVVAYYLDFGFGGGVVPYPWNGGLSQNIKYTHWMPLPPPPAPELKQESDAR